MKMLETFFFFFFAQRTLPSLFFPATASEKGRRRKRTEEEEEEEEKKHPVSLSFLFSCRHDVTHFRSLSSDLFHHHITKGPTRQRVAATYLRHDGAHQSRHAQTHFWRSNSQLQQQQRRRRRRRRMQLAGAGGWGGSGHRLDVFNR